MMKGVQKKYCLFLFLLFFIPALVYAKEGGNVISPSMNNYYSGDIWQPDSVESDTTSVLKKKISFSDIAPKFNIDEMMDKVETTIASILDNPRVLLLNAAIQFASREMAVLQCGGNLEQILMEYPEQAKKLAACIQEGMGDANKVSVGAATGTASFAEFTNENNPGIFSKISGCIGRELGEEYGEGMRRCIDRQTEDNVNTIRDILNWAMEYDFNNTMLARQAFLLEERLKETDLVKAIGEYGSILSPDGTSQVCENGECLNKKMAWASFALTKVQDLEIKNVLLEYIQDISIESSLPSIKKEKIYTLILDWYENIFTESNVWLVEESCNAILAFSQEDVIGQLPAEIADMSVLFLNDKAALTETVTTMKTICSYYLTYAKEMMFTASATAASPGFSSQVQREVWQIGQQKLSTDLDLLNLSQQAKKAVGQSAHEASKKATEDYKRTIKRAMEKVK